MKIEKRTLRSVFVSDIEITQIKNDAAIKFGTIPTRATPYDEILADILKKSTQA